MSEPVRPEVTEPSRASMDSLHVLAHFARILLAAGLLAGVLAGDPAVARAQDAPGPAAPPVAPQGGVGDRIAAHQKAAQQLIHDGRLADARDELLAALALDPKVSDTHALLAAVSAKAERWAEALASYEKALEIGPPRSALHYGVGVCKRAQGDFAAANAALAKARELGEKELASAREARASASLPEGTKPAPGAPSEELTATIRAETIATATLTEVNYQLAIVARELGDDEGEGAALERGLALSDAHPKLLGEKGAWLFRKGDAPSAVAVLEKAQGIPGADLSLLYDLGRALLRVPGREADGRARLAEYRERDEARRAKVSDERRRGQAATLAARAELELREGRKGPARDLAARALELDPTNDRAQKTAAAAAQ